VPNVLGSYWTINLNIPHSSRVVLTATCRWRVLSVIGSFKKNSPNFSYGALANQRTHFPSYCSRLHLSLWGDCVSSSCRRREVTSASYRPTEDTIIWTWNCVPSAWTWVLQYHQVCESLLPSVDSCSCFVVRARSTPSSPSYCWDGRVML